jgi:molecular chaperone HscB
MDTTTCWSCKAARAPTDALCPACGKVQPAPGVRLGAPSVLDKFAIVGLQRSFDVDLADLESRFRAGSRKVHPDRFQRATPQERRFALEQTKLLNDAVRTLQDPVRRAEHLLELRGLHLAAERPDPHGLHVQQPPTLPMEFLEELMEAQESLQEAKAAGDQEAISRMAAAMRAKRDETLDRVAAILRGLERGGLPDPAASTMAAGELLARMRTFARFLDESEGRASPER